MENGRNRALPDLMRRAMDVVRAWKTGRVYCSGIQRSLPPMMKINATGGRAALVSSLPDSKPKLRSVDLVDRTIAYNALDAPTTSPAMQSIFA